MESHDVTAHNRESLQEDSASLYINDTVRTQLNHRTIRKFTDEPLSDQQLSALLEVARHTATSSFYQQSTIIRVLDPQVRHQVFLASGQSYVDGTAGELWVFIADVHRNAQIRAEAGLDPEVSERATTFFQAVKDTLLAAQNVVVAAESMGLGTVYLGSISGDTNRVIEALKLPYQTFPVVGLLIGHPDQEPQFKPRLPLTFTVGVNEYPGFEDLTQALADYDQSVSQYYDLRDENKRVDQFTSQIIGKMGGGKSEKAPFLEELHAQGLCLR